MLVREDIERELLDRAGSDESFRALLLENPNEAVRQALSLNIPSSFTLKVHEEDATSLHLVLPPSQQLTDDELASVAAANPTAEVSC